MEKRKQKPIDLGRRLASLRESAGLTHVQLARKAGLYPGTIRAIEDTGNSRYRTLIKIARALGTSVPAMLSTKQTNKQKDTNNGS